MSGWEIVRNAFANVWTRIRDSSGSGGGPTWFDELQNCEDGELLGISLGIDIVSGAVDEALVASALDYLPDGSDARRRFYDAVNQHPSPLRGISRLAPAMPQDVKYVRILELGDFIYYYLGDYGYTTDPSDVARVRELFLRRPRPLGDIRAAWSGARGIVWVVGEDEVRSVMDAKSADDAAEDLVDRLGLALKGGVGPNNSLDMVAVTYPVDFEQTYQRCHQPTAFDANWETPGTLYLSHGRKDNWGRTRSCTGQRMPMPERVHGVVEKLSDSFVLIPIGVTMPPVKDRTTMISEAYQRLAQAAG